jgi:diguanylate cyclase (GGDEF)-like protein
MTAAWLSRTPAVSDQEEIVHEMTLVLERSSDSAVIERALIDAVRRLTRAQRVQLIRDEALPAASAAGVQELLLCAGAEYRGKLLVVSPPNQTRDWSPATVLRLKTLCTMAACGLARRQGHGTTARAREEGFDEPAPDGGSGAPAVCEHDETGTLDGHFAVPVLQDATFLNAVLPFALGQARRHGEPLSLLCVAVDRLAGIHELLGKETALRAVSNVGAHVAGLIRSSDIVARMDDDRIIVVLPRARLRDALCIAQKLCLSVEQNPVLLPELYGLTISIGVAECPACAETVLTLLDAADEALGLAKTQGRNRAVAAPASSARGRIEPACLVG